jgi:8-oxo-dGTP pyrophosphatase MutT (NUDIX family)
MQLTIKNLDKALRRHGPELEPGYRYAAVAIILREQRKQLEVLVIQRSHHPDDPWSGHLAFPGGRHEPHEQALQQTAVRETLEELGVDLNLDACWVGALDPVRAAHVGDGKLVVAPFVYTLTGEVCPQPDPLEVQRYFWVPLQPILCGERQAEHQVQWGQAGFRMPGYRVEDQILWGLSYRMLNSLLHHLRATTGGDFGTSGQRRETGAADPGNAG